MAESDCIDALDGRRHSQSAYRAQVEDNLANLYKELARSRGRGRRAICSLASSSQNYHFTIPKCLFMPRV